MLSKPKERERFIKFAIVGAVGAIIDFSVFNLFIQVFLISSLLAGTLSFVAAVLSNFFWNRYWTYPDSRSKPLFGQLLQFSIVSIIGLGIRLGLFWVFEEKFISLSQSYLRFQIINPTIVGHNLTLAMAILIVMLWNFFINRFWTYNDVE